MSLISIFLNNTLVLLIYSMSGLLVRNLTGSKLAPAVPWAILFLHGAEITAGLWSAALNLGLLTALAFVLPHGVLEIIALVGGCVAGSKFTAGKYPLGFLGVCWFMLLVAALIEAWITPFPFQAWVNY